MVRTKSKEQIELIGKSGKVMAEIFQKVPRQIRPGVTTDQIDKWIEKFIKDKGGKPAFKGYRGYPKSTCISVNEEVVHSIPSSRVLKEGDIVSIDVGISLGGYISDAAMTFPVGRVSGLKRKLIKVTREALYRGIQQAKVGHRVGDISFAIQQWVEKHNFSVVKVLFGHGVGFSLHEDPVIPNFGQPHRGERIREGMVLAIEPMVNAGEDKVKVLPNHWTVVTVDGKPSAHFEHTVGIVNGNAKILTSL